MSSSRDLIESDLTPEEVGQKIMEANVSDVPSYQAGPLDTEWGTVEVLTWKEYRGAGNQPRPVEVEFNGERYKQENGVWTDWKTGEEVERPTSRNITYAVQEWMDKKTSSVSIRPGHQPSDPRL